MAPLNWATYLERAVGKGHPTLSNTIDRALRQMLSESGYDPDATTFPGLMGPVFNVRAFANGVSIDDGSTDATGAFQATAAAIGSAGGGIFYIPPTRLGGSYVFAGSTSPVVDLPSNCTVVGSDQAGLLKAASGASFSHWFRISGKSHVTVQRVAFDGNNMPAFRACIVLRGTDPSHIRLLDNHFFDSNAPASDGQDRYAIAVVPEAGHAQNIWIIGNHVNNGMQIKTAGPGKNVYVLHNRVKDAYNNAISLVTLQDDAALSVEDYIVAHNIIDNPHLQGIFAGSDGAAVLAFKCRRIKIVDNIVRRARNSSNFGILFYNTATTHDIEISRNLVVFDGATPAGIGIAIEDGSGTSAIADRVDISDNTIIGFDQEAIRANDVKNLTFNRNKASGCRGFVFDEVQSAVVGDNISDGAISQAGFRFVAVSDFLVHDNIAKGAVTNVDGFRVAPTAGKVAAIRFTGNRAFGSTQRYGVNEVAAGGTFNTQYTDNDFSGNATSGVNNINTAAYRRGNRLTVGAQQGRAVLVNGTVTVSTAEVLASDNIALTRVVGTGTTRGPLTIGTIVAGTSFVIRSEDATGALSADDDSTVFWEIVH